MEHFDANPPSARPFSLHLDRQKPQKHSYHMLFFKLARFLQISNIPVVLPSGCMKQLSR